MNSQLNLTCGFFNGKTRIDDIYSTPPYKIMHPFTDGEKMEIILMSSSAGLLKGDTFECELYIREGANLTFSTQSYEKILDTMDGHADRKLKIQVENRGVLNYIPQPVIPFKNSDFRARSDIYFKEDSKVIYSDICSCGRVGMGEKFQFKNYRSRTNFYLNEHLVFTDYTYLNPKEIDYERLGMWDGYTHSGLLFIYRADMENLDEKCREIQENAESRNLLTGASRCTNGLLIRSLGEGGDQIYKFHMDLIKNFR
ncbi:MAG: urease accessory protein UreD [Butyrivibrio sp.]|nr:urease accessory protein UreD [Butyrivibrio sp.]